MKESVRREFLAELPVLARDFVQLLGVLISNRAVLLPMGSLANRYFDNFAQQREKIDEALDGKFGHLFPATVLDRFLERSKQASFQNQFNGFFFGESQISEHVPLPLVSAACVMGIAPSAASASQYIDRSLAVH